MEFGDSTRNDVNAQTTFEEGDIDISRRDHERIIQHRLVSQSSASSTTEIGGIGDQGSAETGHRFDLRRFPATPEGDQTLSDNKERSVAATSSNTTGSSSVPTYSFDSHEHHDKENLSASQCWTKFVLMMQKPLKRLLVTIAVHAARFPKLYLVTIFGISAALAYTGYKTNFRIESQEQALWAPTGSLPVLHEEWIDSVFLKKGGRRRQLVTIDMLGGVEQQQEYAYPSWWTDVSGTTTTRPFGTTNNDYDFTAGENSGRFLQGTTSSTYLGFLVHTEGGNVISKEGVERNFEALARLQAVAGYTEYCAEYGTPPCPGKIDDIVCVLYGIPIAEDTPNVCQAAGVTGLWFHNSTIFEKRVETDYDVQKAMAVDLFPGEKDEFDIANYVGNPNYEVVNGTKVMVSGTAYLTGMRLSLAGFAEYPKLMDDLLDAMLQLQAEWDANADIPFRLEVINGGAYEDELIRGIVNDLPLVPLVGILMSGFTALVFFKCDWVQSQCLLGFGAVACIILSLLSGYGIMFIIGYPFTTLSLALVFIIFGIGLDDSFILYSAYLRSNENKSGVDRVRDTMNEVAISILMTTVTTELAFALGSFSQIPAIRWLCMYAFTTVGVDFIYQITFFISLVAIDDARMKARRRDCCVCLKVRSSNEKDWDDDNDNDDDQNHPEENSNTLDAASHVPNEDLALQTKHDSEKLHCSGRIMSWYADKLLQPRVKAVVLLTFAVFFGVCLWSTLQLRLYFDFLSVLPSGSYVSRFYRASNLYTNQQGPDPYIYFRNVDHSDPKVWEQMETYVNSIVEIDAISRPPFNFWLRDYKEYIAHHEEELQDLTFNQRLQEFLRHNQVQGKKSYAFDMLFDDEGNLLASRTQLIMDRIDTFKISEGIDAIRDQRAITEAQPINQDSEKGDWSFFTYDSIYLMYEFLLVTPKELRQSTLIGIGSVSAMSIFFMPHWSGILFVTPLVMFLYIDLMGFIQFFGIEINGISFVSLVMAIGLLVDYVMHVVLRFYEATKMSSRDARVKEVLETMGASVLLGGLSTFLGIFPLVFSGNEIIRIFVITFFGVVILGLSHGLVLLPVLLSILGPQEQVFPSTPQDFSSPNVKLRKIRSQHHGREITLIDI